MPRALLSVSDKSGLAGFARGLGELGFELYSTGGTLVALREAGVEARPVSDLTGFPEILDGRVKTLHPGVHGGLLARRDVPADMRALAEHGLQAIDLLCVNLYPFVAAAGGDAPFEEVVEQIDVGGPAMVRAAAKNHAFVAVVVRPQRYQDVLARLGAGGLDPAFRRLLAAEAFGHTAAYDAHISGWLRARDEALGEVPAQLTIAGDLVQGLRYGENPHQSGAFYRTGAVPSGLGGARQLQGRELSYNNIQDAAAAYRLALDFTEPAAAIIKHMNPCGLALADDLAGAYGRAFECDTVSAFGGVVAVNRPLDAATARAMAEIFLEVVVAPEVDPEAAAILAAKRSLRVLVAPPPAPGYADLDVRSVPGGFLVQSWDRLPFDRGTAKVVSRRPPTAAEWDQLEFAWRAVGHVKSNAIVLAAGLAAVGVGAGQMSRVEAVRLAAARAGDRARGSVMASDAFFPFPDAVEEAIAAGVTAVIQPGGSVRDGEVVAAADRAGLAMVTTGVRHFRH